MILSDPRRCVVLLVLAVVTPSAWALPSDGAAPVAPITAAIDGEADPLPAIQSRWAEISYSEPEKSRVAAFEALATQIGDERTRHPDDLRLLVWEGITLASQAGAQGGLGALALCKRAKADFEQVIARDGSVLDGSAYTSLGSLYYQVPGWPLGFGDDKKARDMLQRGLQVAPDGIDANYFYGDFLLDQGHYAEAVSVLEKALAAPARAGRESADAGRRKEILQALERARRKLR